MQPFKLLVMRFTPVLTNIHLIDECIPSISHVNDALVDFGSGGKASIYFRHPLVMVNEE